MDDDEAEFASPACSLNEADDVYRGFASKEEIAECLELLAKGESGDIGALPRLREFLPRIRDDRLHARIRDLLSKNAIAP